MKKAVIYARYSSDSQSEQSIEGQLRVCNEYAKNNNIVIVKTYIDRAMTGTNDNRPDFQKMLYDSHKREWDYVLVYKFDRFSRNKYETAVHKKMLKDNGIKVISATEFVPDTPEGIILESMLEGYAEYYSAELSQKIRRGNNESWHKGNLTGGGITYGYKNVNKKAVIVDEEATIIRYIFDQYALGMHIKEIIADLHSKGLTRRGKPFVCNTIYKTLKNERYVGIYRHNNEVYDNIFPPIITKELFDKVQAKAKYNNLGKRSYRISFLLKGKTYCGYCGKHIAGDSGTGKNGEYRYYYSCSGRKKGLNDCMKMSIQKDVLENLVLDYIKHMLEEDSVMNEIVDNVIKEQRKFIDDNAPLKAMQKEKKITDNAIENILNAIENGGSSPSIMQRLHTLEEKHQTLEEQIAIEKAKNASLLTKSEVREFYGKAMTLSGKMLIEYLVKKIIVFDDKIQIIFNSPLTYGSPDESLGFSIIDEKATRYYKVHYGNKMIQTIIETELKVE